MPAGRPRKYKTVEELQKIVDLYFEECDPHWIEEEYYDYPLVGEVLEPQSHGGSLKRTFKRDYNSPMTLQKRWVKTEQEPYTMAGLARRIDLSRQALMEYKGTHEFGDTIKAARAKVEEYNERVLLSGKAQTGAIFNLKVNFGYKENVEDNPPPENPIVFINNVPITPESK